MARRSDHTHTEIRALAVASGWQQLGARGLRHFSARQVAVDIGYTIGTLYNVFGSHDALLLAINGRTLDHWYAAMEKALAHNRKKPRLRALAHFYIAYAGEHTPHWLALFEHQMEHGKPLPRWYQQKLQRFFDQLEDTIVASTGLGRKKARREAYLLWASIHGITMLSITAKLALVGAGDAITLADAMLERYGRVTEH
jgi:AcrR family transcriptional regulator